MNKIVYSAFLFLALVRCSSPPKNPEPEWLHQPSRVVDNGYIVYIGTAVATSQDSAQFRAEGLALEDLANECSLIPLGTRIEDRYVHKEKYEYTAYVKVALEFQECDQARKALEPGDIRKIANLPFTEQLKKYQDLTETGQMPERGEVAQVEPPESVEPAPARAANWNDSTHFYVVRQYVAYQKEVVILSPPTAYAPGSPQAKSFVLNVQPSAEQIQNIETKTPTYRTQAYSKVPDRPTMARPTSLAPPPRVQSKSVVPPAPPRAQRGGGPGRPAGPKPRRHRRRGEEFPGKGG